MGGEIAMSTLSIVPEGLRRQLIQDQRIGKAAINAGVVEADAFKTRLFCGKLDDASLIHKIDAGSVILFILPQEILDIVCSKADADNADDLVAVILDLAVDKALMALLVLAT